MSDLIIKGMEMPKHAVRNGTDDTMYRSCVLVHPDGTAELVVDLEFADKFNFEHCLKHFPLVEVPTPHGRLIDADAHIQSLKENQCGERCRKNHDCVNCGIGMYIRIVENEPTVIEAEE